MDEQTAEKIIERLSTVYSDKPSLNYNSAYELLVAVVLSAQCTDKRVNEVTSKLFPVANTPEKMIALGQKSLEKYIFSCGLYRTKAEHVISLSKDISERFNGQVPDNLKDLQSLAGVGRKTANVVYAVWFGGQVIAVDTHVFRVSEKIGFTKNSSSPLQTEKTLTRLIPEKDRVRAHHYLIYLGRDTCKASFQDCERCVINDLCEKGKTRR